MLLGLGTGSQHLAVSEVMALLSRSTVVDMVITDAMAINSKQLIEDGTILSVRKPLVLM
jgi:hypothetical protein